MTDIVKRAIEQRKMVHCAHLREAREKGATWCVSIEHKTQEGAVCWCAKLS